MQKDLQPRHGPAAAWSACQLAQIHAFASIQLGSIHSCVYYTPLHPPSARSAKLALLSSPFQNAFLNLSLTPGRIYKPSAMVGYRLVLDLFYVQANVRIGRNLSCLSL